MKKSAFEPQEVDRIRNNFPHLQTGHIYLNHAAISPISAKVRRAIDHFLDNRSSGKIDNIEFGMSVVAETRELLADYINAESPDQISFMGNTSDGISAVAEGVNWESGDEILLNRMEFPSNVQPYRILERRGVNIRYIEPRNNVVTPEMVKENITPKTKLLSISAVQYLTGFKANLEAIGKICSENNIIFVVDAIQYLGAGKIDVQLCNIDALATGGHKWLMSPMGSGFLYLSEQLAQHLRPAKTGWLSVEEPWALSSFEQNWLPVSQHLETGTPNMIGLVGMNASLKNLIEIGPERITRQITNLTEYLTENLSSNNKVVLISPVNRTQRAGIVTFSHKDIKDSDAFVESLKKRNITISSREGMLRVAPHYYNSFEEVETVLNAIAK
ncbi:aminotransferase class V-fold PLP-dependent enzyme [Rhodohalobacter halophilus]|uniref:aminotransferase class V-fold PLP-dependent enzyme n=1 Tax=Rhodohalobacter halophilus TaxID=1812810 RepID=UPI00083F7DE8|nr:aminotransferase class V-fold PLP-dependent enzyme [Rhodohalobacter halophilus]